MKVALHRARIRTLLCQPVLPPRQSLAAPLSPARHGGPDILNRCMIVVRVVVVDAAVADEKSNIKQAKADATERDQSCMCMS